MVIPTFGKNLETRVQERITNHPSIDTSPSYSQIANILHSTQIEAAINKFML